MDAQDWVGKTCLMFAAEYNDADAVRMLVDAGQYTLEHSHIHCATTVFLVTTITVLIVRPVSQSF